MRLLFLDIDTLRPDHLGCYGYGRPTSPNIDRIAAGGMRFDQYFCSDAPCLPSRIALITGQCGLRNGVVGHGGTAADPRLQGSSRGFTSEIAHLSLWGWLTQRGLHTASVSPFAQRHSAVWFPSGLTETYDTGRGGMESAEEVTPVALDWLARHARDDNWVLHVNYWDPHTPYRAPAEFGNPFEDQPLPSWMTEDIIAAHNRLPGGHSSREINMWDDAVSPRYPRHPGSVTSLADFRRLIDGYDCGVAYADLHVGRLLNALADAGVLDDTAILVTSDHGENLGELNSYAEHGSSDYCTHRIPMIIRWPDSVAGHVDHGLHYNLDLGPTLAELLDAPPRPGWQGRSYAPALQSGAACGHEQLVLGACTHSAMRSVRFGPWQYLRVYHDFFHLWPREMLFNVAEDPHETNDLASARPEVCAEAARRLLDWHDQQMSGLRDAVDPLWTVMREGGPEHCRGALPAYLERLKATGRGEHVAALTARHGGELGGRSQS